MYPDTYNKQLKVNLYNQREKERKHDNTRKWHEKEAIYKRKMEKLKGNLDIGGYRDLLGYLQRNGTGTYWKWMKMKHHNLIGIPFLLWSGCEFTSSYDTKFLRLREVSIMGIFYITPFKMLGSSTEILIHMHVLRCDILCLLDLLLHFLFLQLFILLCLSTLSKCTALLQLVLNCLASTHLVNVSVCRSRVNLRTTKFKKNIILKIPLPRFREYMISSISETLYQIFKVLFFSRILE